MIQKRCPLGHDISRNLNEMSKKAMGLASGRGRGWSRQKVQYVEIQGRNVLSLWKKQQKPSLATIEQVWSRWNQEGLWVEADCRLHTGNGGLRVLLWGGKPLECFHRGVTCYDIRFKRITLSAVRKLDSRMTRIEAEQLGGSFIMCVSLCGESCYSLQDNKGDLL